MAGFTDMPFRVICSELGVSHTVSEMISAAAICYKDKKTAELCRISEREAPCALQLFGHDPAQMAYAAEELICKAEEGKKPVAIDINMGCPVKKIVTSGDGSALMKTPEVAEAVVRAVYKVTERYNVPLWVKIRAGWNSGSINASEFAKMLADCGTSLITVHGRTREQMYMPSSDNGVIRSVREAVPEKIPVIGNGDVCSYADAVRMINETGCDGVAVGRAALGDPWIFRSMAEGTEYQASVEERINMALRLTRDVVSLKGELCGIREARGRAAHFIRGIRGSAVVREKLNRAVSLSEFSEILSTLKEQQEL